MRDVVVVEREDRMIRGVDFGSVDKNKVDWPVARARGDVSFAILRSSYGTWDDSAYTTNAEAAMDAGVVVGGYLFLRMEEDVEDQCERFIDNETFDLAPTLDVEFPTNKADAKKREGRASWGLTAKQALDRVVKAWDYIDQVHATPILYTSARVWAEDLGGLKPPKRILESPLWLARYHKTDATIVDPPTPWGDADNWFVHQYRGDVKGVPGFSNQVDLNRFNPLVLGDKGTRVEWLQRKLHDFRVKVDGDFGKETLFAVRELQNDMNIDADGIVGPRTFAILSRLD